MSDIGEPTEQLENATALNQSEQPVKLDPLYRQFTPKLAMLLFTVVVITGLIITSLYQNYIRKNALIENQLVPLTQQLNKISVLHKADKLIDNLLIAANAESYVSLYAELIAIDRQLLGLNNSENKLFQQWLNKHKSGDAIAFRIQNSHVYNQQLKQNSITQLQLMMLSITSFIDNELLIQKTLQKQLQAEQTQNSVSFNQANRYVKSAQQLNNLQNLQFLLAEVLASFEQLTMYTPIASFELLRLNIEQFFIQSRYLNKNSNRHDMVTFNQQVDAFEKIVLTEQRALAKWQGYLRLAQVHHAILDEQQQQLNQLLLAPYQPNKVKKVDVISNILHKLPIQLSDKNMAIILILTLALLLLFFGYLVWQIGKQIKLFAQQSVDIIISNLEAKKEEYVVANCEETQTIIEKIQRFTKPKHNEQEFEALSKQYQSSVQQQAQKKQALEKLKKRHDQQQIDYKNQVADLLSNEIKRYKYLETVTLPIIQQRQFDALGKELSKELSKELNKKTKSITTRLSSLYQQLTQFHLALEVQLDKSALNLDDINLANEIHAILFTKQEQQQCNENSLFISYDEQLLSQARMDFRLFQQLINLFIDISLDNCQKSQLHLHVQLQDKSAGQQRVHFVAKVKKQSSENLPSLINQLLESQVTTQAASPLISVFNILLTKQHGKNIVAQLDDDGYQLSFELPLAIADSADHRDKITLDNTNVMLLSNNTLLATLLENNIQSAKGKFEKLTRIDSFQQQVKVNHLNHHRLDLLMIDSDMARTHLDLITEQINGLPKSLQPKLMVLQSNKLSYDNFGFYSQAEQVLCQNNLLHNIKALLASDHSNNQLHSCKQLIENKYIKNELSLLLAVESPQHSQNLQRLLLWLGFQVQVVAHKAAQKMLWKTGEYNLLITEFAETALLEMTSKPLVKVGVFSLADVVPQSKNNAYFETWHFGKLTRNSTLAELINALAPWLKQAQGNKNINSSHIDINHNVSELPINYFDESEEFVITEVASIYTENSTQPNNDNLVFDFSQYLQHQGTAELALFMLDDYTQDNHQQLDTLVKAIKAKNIEKAQLAISALALNAKILSAQELQSLCFQWSNLLTGSEIPSSLNKINTLLKETRIALNEIDEYAESIPASPKN